HKLLLAFHVPVHLRPPREAWCSPAPADDNRSATPSEDKAGPRWSRREKSGNDPRGFLSLRFDELRGLGREGVVQVEHGVDILIDSPLHLAHGFGEIRWAHLAGGSKGPEVGRKPFPNGWVDDGQVPPTGPQQLDGGELVAANRDNGMFFMHPR